MKKEKCSQAGSPSCEFKEIIDEFSEVFNLIEDYENNSITYERGTVKHPIRISPKEFLTVINGIPPKIRKELYIMPRDKIFKKTIEKIYDTENQTTIEEKAVHLLYSIIKSKNFKTENTQAAIICFLYFLKENKLLDKILTIEKETIFLIILLMQKSTRDDVGKIINLTIKIFSKS